jgi:hypothetical protein
MKVIVESIWAGHGEPQYRMTMPNGSREFVCGPTWRSVATEALDILQVLYHFKRRNVKFIHK